MFWYQKPTPSTSAGWGYRAGSTATGGQVWAGEEPPAPSTPQPTAAGTGGASRQREPRRTALPPAGQHRLVSWPLVPAPSCPSPPSKWGQCGHAGTGHAGTRAALHLRIPCRGPSPAGCSAWGERGSCRHGLLSRSGKDPRSDHVSWTPRATLSRGPAMLLGFTLALGTRDSA